MEQAEAIALLCLRRAHEANYKLRKPVAWTTVAAPGRGTGAEATLSSVLGYVDADVIEQACLRIPIARNMIAADGTVADPDIRSRLAAQLTAVAGHVRPTPSSARAQQKTWP